MQKSSGKQATRGQKQIHEENQNTIFQYSMASAITSGLYLMLNLFVFGPTNGTWV